MSRDTVINLAPVQHTAITSAGDLGAATMLAALAALSSTSFPSATAAIDAYLDLLARLVGVRSTFVSQITSDTLLVLDSFDNDGCAIPSDGAAALKETPCQYVRATGQAVIVSDAAADVRTSDLATRHQFSIGAYLGVPLLLSDGTFFGTLCALDPQPCQFSPAQVDLARVAASQIAALIEREGLHRTLDQQTAAAERLSATQQALEQQTELLRVVAHDIRTPLTTITGYTSLLKTGLFGAIQQEQAEVLDRIGAAARFINRLANDLIDSAAAETQTMALIIEQFDPRQIVERIAGGCAAEAQQKGLALGTRCTAAPATIAGDPDRLQQVLLNLMSNAMRYTERGSITLALDGSAADTIEFRVEDTGPGIAAELHEQIWQRYTRASTHGSGIGLGLYVVRQLVGAMGGTVGVESAVGSGASFWVRLPVQGPRPQSFQWS